MSTSERSFICPIPHSRHLHHRRCVGITQGAKHGNRSRRRGIHLLDAHPARQQKAGPVTIVLGSRPCDRPSRLHKRLAATPPCLAWRYTSTTSPCPKRSAGQALLIHCTPAIVLLTSNLHEDFNNVERVAATAMPAPQTVGKDPGGASGFFLSTRFELRIHSLDHHPRVCNAAGDLAKQPGCPPA